MCGKHQLLWSRYALLLLIAFFVCSTKSLAEPKELSSLAPVKLMNVSAEVTTGSSPDNSHQVFTAVIDKAKRSLNVAIYVFRCDFLADSIIAALDRGVKVKVLFDGWPVGMARVAKVDAQTLYIAKRLREKGADVRFIASNLSSREDRRFKYMHAKYAVADGETLYLSSENVGSNSGHPVSRSTGNRGWSIAVKNAAFARAYNAVFDNDWKGQDIVAYGASTDYTMVDVNFVPSRQLYSGTYVPWNSTHVTDTMDLERVLSPDDSSARGRAILGAIRKAKSSLKIQELSFAPHWGSDRDTPETVPSPLAEEVLAAARRGVKVRVMLQPPYVPGKTKPVDNDDEDENTPAPLLNDLEAWFQSPAIQGLKASSSNSRSNGALISYFRQVAQRENLDLQANYFWVEADGIRTLHNKGMVVDAATVLVSSVNWGENSVLNNREAAVLVTNTKVANYYESLFERDWRYNRNSH